MSWNMSHMIHFFQNASIQDVSALRNLSNEKFKEIIESHGDLMEILNLKECIDKWKQTNIENVEIIDVSIQEDFNVSIQEVLDDSIQEEENNEETPKCTSSISLKRKARSSALSFMSFKEYFMKDFNGRVIDAKFKKDSLLSWEQRGHVTRSACEYLLLDVPGFPLDKPRNSEYKPVAEEIMSMFPGLFTMDNLCGSKQKLPNGRTSYVRGRLQQRIYDHAKLEKARRKTLENLQENPMKETVVVDEALNESDPLDVEEQLNQDMQFLKNNSGPESKVLEIWKSTFSKRKDNMQLDEYPSLQLSFAPSMVFYDFEKLFPGKCDDFKLNFERYKKNMMRQFNTQIKDKIGKERIKYLEMNPDSKSENLLYLSLLPFLFKPTASKATKMKRTSCIGMSDMFICHVKVRTSHLYKHFLIKN